VLKRGPPRVLAIKPSLLSNSKLSTGLTLTTYERKIDEKKCGRGERYVGGRRGDSSVASISGRRPPVARN